MSNRTVNEITGETTVVSARSFTEEAQQTPSWCYAAVQRMIQAAYGGNPGTQLDIALAYCDIDPPSGWSQMSTEQRKQAAQRHWGNPIFNDGEVANGGINDQTIRQVIDGDGLFIYGNSVHWLLVYGYVSNRSGQVAQLLVYDPYNGGRRRTVDIASYRDAVNTQTIYGFQNP